MPKWLQAIINFFKGMAASKPAIDKPVEKPPVKVPKDLKKLLGRDEYNDLNNAIFEGRIKVRPYTDYPYVNLRETNGNNRSKGIDPLIRRQGGDVGNAYCLFGQQDKMDGLAEHLGIPRKFWNYPEGGSTQRVFDATDAKYKRSTPKPACFVTIEYNKSGKGHIEDVSEVHKVIDDLHVIKTRAFNTTIDGDDSVNRDGAGAGYATRNIRKEWKQGSDTVRLRGYVDHYLIYVDAHKKFYGI